ncbi:uncharacterized protein LOC105442869 [Strongylocentrotus purpuratus]|uniref:Uncharacterized protein n=1 Tax=Strongylocentrotus purpuratus TaxID=7668 RepID=A0A7M7HPB8_STRPU|nr:uncharacterized protein LOC105442869 [Strongylocentrotus purpuratus]
MNEVMRNAKTFLGLVQTAKTDAAGHWNREAFQRAMQWAEYFEGVYKKLETKAEVVTKFSRGLEIISSQPGACSGPSPVTFADLKHSRRMLLKILLQNPYLSGELYSLVLDNYNSLSSSPEGLTGTDMLNQDATECSHAKAQRETLLGIKAFTSQAVERMEKRGHTDHTLDSKDMIDVEIQTDACILHQHLLHHLSKNPSSQSTLDYLHDKLEEIAQKPHGLEIISFADSHLISQEHEEQREAEDSSDISAEIRCKRLLSDWLLKRVNIASANEIKDDRKPP